jgi:hypothetical protein
VSVLFGLEFVKFFLRFRALPLSVFRLMGPLLLAGFEFLGLWNDQVSMIVQLRVSDMRLNGRDGIDIREPRRYPRSCIRGFMHRERLVVSCDRARRTQERKENS